MQTDIAGLLVLGITLASFLVVGIRAREAGDDLDDYVAARNSQDARALGLSFFASGMGAWILFAPPEVGAFVGIVAAVGYAVGAAGPFVAYAALGRRIREVVPAGHGLTEFVRLRFGPAFHAYVVAISILYMFVFVAAELTAVGSVAAIVSGIDARLVIVTVAAVTLLYTAYGGLRASLRTDRLQSWLVLALLAAGVVAIITRVDVPAGSAAATGLLDVGAVGVEAAVTLVIAVTAANLFHQGYWQRVFAARSSGALGRGAAIGVVATAPVVLVVGGLGILAASSGVALGDPPAPFFALLTNLPGWVQLVVLALGVSLVASSVDTLENGLASLVVQELPRLDLRAARVATVVPVVLASGIAFAGFSVLRLFLIADLLCAATVVPALLGLWRRATPTGALAGAVAGLVGAVTPGWITTGSFVEGVRLATFPGATPTLPPFAWALAISSAVAVTISLAGRHVEDFEALRERVPVLDSH